MKTPASCFAVCFAVALGLGAITLTPGGVRAQDFREEGPIEIEKCKTISQPGSYKLVNNLTFTSPSGTCLSITANNVTIDLAGFTISGPGMLSTTIAVQSSGNLQGIAVRNGSISGFPNLVDLGLAVESIVEGLRVSDCTGTAILADGIVRGNTVSGCGAHGGSGISATGIITGNSVEGGFFGIGAGPGSTVIGNTVTNILEGGIDAGAGSTVIGDTVTKAIGLSELEWELA